MGRDASCLQKKDVDKSKMLLTPSGFCVIMMPTYTMKGKYLLIMKKIWDIIMLSLLALIFCVTVTSCGASDSTSTNINADTNEPAGTGASGNIVIAETKNDAADAEISSFSVGYLTKEAYNNGNFVEDAITKTLNFLDREAQYMVVDLKIKTLSNDASNKSLKVMARASEAFALTVIVEEAPTGKLEPVDNADGSRTYDLIYSLPENKDGEKTVRMILKLLPNVGGNVNVDITVSGVDAASVSGKTGASAAFSVPSINLKFMLKSDNSYSVCGTGVCANPQIIIPSTYNGAPVTSIETHEFSDCFKLTGIVIPDSVTSIGNRAFDCVNLEEISVHENNTYYCSENGVLFNKAKTELICYPEGKTETTYLIPDSVTSIGKWAFYSCSNLTDVVIHDSVTSIDYGAFCACGGLRSITVPDSVTSIGNSAFSGCSSLTSMTLPFVGNTANGTRNTYFGYIFGSISSSDNGVYVPSSLKTVVITNGSNIGSFIFSDCSNLTSISLPDSVTSIGDSAFSGCSSLMSIVIPDNVTSIGASAFSGCSSLMSIIIPDNVTSIGASAFSDCKSLTSITLPFVGGTANGTDTTHFGYIFGADSYFDNGTYVPSSLKTVVVMGGSKIDSFAFSGCSSLMSITIPDGITSIGYAAFDNCNGLTRIEIPDSVTSIGNIAFRDCAGLTSIVIPDGVTSIGDYAFYNCSGVTSITIPDGVTSIGDYAFYNCSGVTSITIPDGVTSIGGYAFHSCSDMTSITIPDSVTSIGDAAFFDCSALTDIRFEGTTSQWKSISFGSYWESYTGFYTVTCTDGTFSKDGPIILS